MTWHMSNDNKRVALAMFQMASLTLYGYLGALLHAGLLYVIVVGGSLGWLFSWCDERKTELLRKLNNA